MAIKVTIDHSYDRLVKADRTARSEIKCRGRPYIKLL